MNESEERKWRELAEDPDPYQISDPEVRHTVLFGGWVELGNSNYDNEQPTQTTEDVSVATEETEREDEPDLFKKLRTLRKVPEWAKPERG